MLPLRDNAPTRSLALVTYGLIAAIFALVAVRLVAIRKPLAPAW